MEKEDPQPIRLTQYSHGSGCGCKIAPADLERILKNTRTGTSDPRVLVGNDTSDDAAVIGLGDGRALISTTDFFMPIVDDAYSFGQIAAANALSDVYAMGGKPFNALAILGWPVESLGTDLAAEVLQGARDKCSEAGISLAGGHSIDSKEPFFGLSVTGLIEKESLLRNAGAKEGDHLILTKSIGTGILAAALKRGMLSSNESDALTAQLSELNAIGAHLVEMDGVHALTDVTGFGLLGHLIEMCEASHVGAEIDIDNVPVLLEQKTLELIGQFVMPNNTTSNFKAYSDRCSKLDAKALQLLCDPQTSGGLLIAVSSEHSGAVLEKISSNTSDPRIIGRITAASDPLVKVN